MQTGVAGGVVVVMNHFARLRCYCS